MSMRRAAFLVLLTSLAHAAPPIRFQHDSSEAVNVLYHTACLSGQLTCSRQVFERFWHNDLAWTPTDKAALDQFSAVFRDEARAAPPPRPAPLFPNCLAWYPSLDARQRLLVAALEGHPDPRLRASLDHFQQRLHSWWQSTGSQRVAHHADDAVKILAAKDLPALATQMARFLESPLRTGDVFLHAIAYPLDSTQGSSGTVRANHFFVEITPEDKPEETAWKAMHELTHYFYDNIPPAKHVAVMNQFLATKAPGVPAFYGLFNEAIATAVQLLAYERLGIVDDDPYHHPYIPRLARATAPLLKRSLAARKTLFHGFAADYIRAGTAEVGTEVASPKFLLAAYAILTGAGNQQARDLFMQEFLPTFSADDEKDWKLFNNLNAVRLVTYDQFSPLPAGVSAAATRGFAWIARHGSAAQVYILAGRTPADVLDAVKQFATLKSVTTEGLLFTLP